jgi:hypothetical protein
MRKALDEEGLHPNWAHVRRLQKKLEYVFLPVKNGCKLVYGSSYHDSSWPSLINLVAATRLSTSRFHIDLTMMMMSSLQNEVSYQIIHGLSSC